MFPMTSRFRIGQLIVSNKKLNDYDPTFYPRGVFIVLSTVLHSSSGFAGYKLLTPEGTVDLWNIFFVEDKFDEVLET